MVIDYRIATPSAIALAARPSAGQLLSIVRPCPDSMQHTGRGRMVWVVGTRGRGDLERVERGSGVNAASVTRARRGRGRGRRGGRGRASSTITHVSKLTHQVARAYSRHVWCKSYVLQGSPQPRPFLCPPPPPPRAESWYFPPAPQRCPTSGQPHFPVRTGL